MLAELPSRWRALGVLAEVTVGADRVRTVVASSLVIAGRCSPLLAGVGVARAVDAAAPGRSALGPALVIGVAVLVHLAAGPPLATVSLTLNDRTAARIERRIVALVSAVPGIEHLERPELLDRVELLQKSAYTIGRSVTTALDTTASAIQLGLTAGLLVTIDPRLVLLPVAALPAVGAAFARERLSEDLDRRTGYLWRAKKGLRNVGWAPENGPDLRLSGAAETVLARQREAVLGLRRAHDRQHALVALITIAADLIFGVVLVAAVAILARRVSAGDAPRGDLVLVLILGQRLSAQVAQTIRGVTDLLRLLRVLAVLAWLRDTVGSSTASPDASRAKIEPPERLRSGIRLRGVRFTYPGTNREVLRGVDLDLRPGEQVALVGDNGAGKTTLVSLLCGFYEPTAGTITVDGVALADIDPAAWRRRLAAVFQEATRLETTLEEAIGIGDLEDDLTPAPADRVDAAVRAAGLEPVVAGLTGGRASRIGRRFPGGTDLSGGQWQKVAHARSAVRREPLLLMLDEPTAALDAQAEHDLFARVRDQSRRSTITVFVSHRFSTVRDAGRIIVLENGRIVEEGPHEALLATPRLYAAMYERQARHYR